MKIDVVIPVRDGEEFILGAIECMRNQIRRPDRLIIVDDGSRDKTRNIIENQPEFGTWIRLVCTEPVGLSHARNTGIRESSADFVAFLDCDDRWTMSKLFNQEKYLMTNDSCQVIFSNYVIQDQEKQIIVEGSRNQEHEFSVENVILQKYRVLGSASSIVVARTLFDSAGFFDENLKYGEDYDMWIRLSRITKFCEISSRDVIITKHSNSMQNRKERGLLLFKNALMYLSVWEKNGIIVQGNPIAYKLLWPDIRKALAANPLSILRFERSIRQDYKNQFDTLFSSELRFYRWIIFNCLQLPFLATRRFIGKY